MTQLHEHPFLDFIPNAGKRLETSESTAYIDGLMVTVRYTTEGPLRGTCGHKHKGLDGAVECLDADEELCVARAPGGHTDRKIFAVGPGLKRDLNEDELAAVALLHRAARRS